MDEWPEGWFRGDEGAGGAGGANDKTARIQPGHPGGQYHVRQYQAGQRAPAPPGNWPAQPPSHSPSGSAAPSWAPSRTGGGGFPGPPRWRGWLRPGRIFGALIALVAVLIV